MNVRLFIDGIEAELSDNTEVAITRQAANVLQLDKRQLDFSNRVTIPATPKNIELMEYLGYNGNQSNRPYKYAPARLEVNGITYADKLVCICDGIEDNGFEIRLLGDPLNPIDQMKSKRLHELFLPFYQHELNADEYRDSQDNTQAYLYPAIQVSYPENQRSKIYVDLAYPALFTRDVFNRLLEEYFNSFTGLWTTDDLWDNDIFFAANINSKNWKDWESVIIKPIGDFTVNSLDPPLPPNFFWLSGTIEKNESGKASTVLIINPSLTKISYKGARTLDIKVKCNLFAKGGEIKIQVRSKPSSQGIPSSSDPIIAESEPAISTIIQDAFIEVDGEISAEIGENTDVYFNIHWQPNDTPYLLSATDIEIIVTPQKNSLYLDDFTPQRYMPDVSQFDFFTEVVKKYGLAYRMNGDDIRLESFADILSGKFGADIWTNKLVRLVNVDYDYGGYAQTNYFNYSGDINPKGTTLYNGWESVSFDNDRLDQEKDVLSMKAKAVEQTADGLLIFGGYETSNSGRVFLQSVSEIIFGRNTFVQDFFRREVLIWKKSATETFTGVRLDDDSGQSTARIDLWNDRITKFYGNLIDSLERPIVREVEVYLSEVDFYNLDFFKLIYLEQFQKFHYLLSVSNYIPGKIVKAKLLEVKGEVIIPKCCDYLVEGIDLIPVITDYCVKYIFQELDWEEFDGTFVQLQGIASDGISGHTWFNLTAGNTGLSQPTTDQLLDLIEERFDDDDGRWTLTRDGNEITICTDDFTTLTVVNISLSSGNSQYSPFPAIEVVSNYATSPFLSPLPVFGELYITNKEIQPNRFEVLVNGEWEDVTDEVTEEGTWSRTSCDETITQWRILNIEDNVIDNGLVNCDQNG